MHACMHQCMQLPANRPVQLTAIALHCAPFRTNAGCSGRTHKASRTGGLTRCSGRGEAAVAVVRPLPIRWCSLRCSHTSCRRTIIELGMAASEWCRVPLPSQAQHFCHASWLSVTSNAPLGCSVQRAVTPDQLPATQVAVKLPLDKLYPDAQRLEQVPPLAVAEQLKGTTAGGDDGLPVHAVSRQQCSGQLVCLLRVRDCSKAQPGGGMSRCTHM